MHGGVVHYFDLSVRPQRDAAGAIVGVTCAALEITERKRAEANLSFLSTLTAALTPQTSAAGVADVVTSSVVRHFGLSRCMLVSIDPTGQTATVFHEHAPGGPSLLGPYAILDFHTEDERRQLAAGHAVVIDDVRTAPRPAEASAQFEQLGIRAMLDVPYLSDGQWRFVLSAVYGAAARLAARRRRAVAGRRLSRLPAPGTRPRRGAPAGGARHLPPPRRSIAVRHLRGRRRFPAGAGQHRRAESVRTGPAAARPRLRGSAAPALAGALCRPGDRHFPAHARDRRAVSRAEHGRNTPGHRRGRVLRLEDRAADVARRPMGRGVSLLRPVGAAAIRGRAARRRSPEGLVPRHAGARAAQSAGADSNRGRRAAHRARRRRKSSRPARTRSSGKRRKWRACSTICSTSLDCRAGGCCCSARRSRSPTCSPSRSRPAGRRSTRNSSSCRSTPATTSLVVDGDGVRLAQVFANLLHNAAKFGGTGGRIARAGAARRQRRGGARHRQRHRHRAELLPRMFELFVQGPAERGGLGIGLSLAQRLVEMHGGAISAHSEGTGKGSEFTVRLPLTSAAVSARPRHRGSPQAPAARKVLIVDDNPDVAEITALLLKGAGCDVRVAYDGATALDTAQAFQPGDRVHGSRNAGAGRLRSLPPDSRVLVGAGGAVDRGQRLGQAGGSTTERRRGLRPAPRETGRSAHLDQDRGCVIGIAPLDGIALLDGIAPLFDGMARWVQGVSATLVASLSAGVR